ncbi:MAG: type III-A CRISPR-associated protein Cas10/Csm1 [Helicobacteraceae bacterium]|jgi:CRISPR-associated protein Csm1|nr:type III-A CRISPR-associated protein Cas10/Csm1 [Helicobacteraceae bacterium]
MTRAIDDAAVQAMQGRFRQTQERNDAKPLEHIFAKGYFFPTIPLGADAIFPVAAPEGALNERVKERVAEYLRDYEKIWRKDDPFAVDYLTSKHLSFVACNDISLYELCKQEAVFAAAKRALQNVGKNADDRQAKNLLIISGDFFGIQRFIFEAIPTEKAAKTLRAKSAYVQLFTRTVAICIAEELGLSYLSVISTGAGKFEILGINDAKTHERIEAIRKRLNEFFVNRHFGETGVGVSVTPCSFADFEQEKYRALRTEIAENVEDAKFHKFDLQSIDPVLEYDDRLDNETLCPYCAKRKKINDESCRVCKQFIQIGERLTKDGFMAICKGRGNGCDDIPIFGDYFISFADNASKFGDQAVAIYDLRIDDQIDDFRGYAKWDIASYVKREGGRVVDFVEIANNSCGGDANFGVKALMSLKGDVDNMGEFIKESKVTASFASFNFFSRMIDYFFSAYAPHLMRKKYNDLYTVFGGGDDLFILGAWDQTIDFAKELRQEFMRFTGVREPTLSAGMPSDLSKGAATDDARTLTLSVGMTLFKPKKPVNFVARITEDLLERSKKLKGESDGNDKDARITEDLLLEHSKKIKGKDLLKDKDAIALFDECVKWDDYIKVADNLIPFLGKFETGAEDLDIINSAFLYRLLEMTEMSKGLKTIKTKRDELAPAEVSKLSKDYGQNALWKSKLRYMFSRNVFDRIGKDREDKLSLANDLLKKLNAAIEEHPEATRMALSEYIYKKRREA